MEHLVSLSVVSVNSEMLFKEIEKFFESHNIPWENLMSVLMDSCRVMRGSKTGLETRIRSEKAPHLLDIDGDSCHHIHNASKKFCEPFGGWLERLFKDIFNDLKWSADIVEGLSKVCEFLCIKYAAPVNMISHRWLSCYDASMYLLHMIDALTIVYYSFLCKNDRMLYFATVCSIYKHRNVESSKRVLIKNLQAKLAVKKLTAYGKERKKRITEKLFIYRRKTQLNLHFYVAALPLLKRYVCLFQSSETLIHKLYEEQRQLFVDFFSCF